MNLKDGDVMYIAALQGQRLNEHQKNFSVDYYRENTIYLKVTVKGFNLN